MCEVAEVHTKYSNMEPLQPVLRVGLPFVDLRNFYDGGCKILDSAASSLQWSIRSRCARPAVKDFVQVGKGGCFAMGCGTMECYELTVFLSLS